MLMHLGIQSSDDAPNAAVNTYFVFRILRFQMIDFPYTYYVSMVDGYIWYRNRVKFKQKNQQ